MLLWLGHSEVSSSRCHGLPSIDEASLVTIQATLAMRPVMLPVHPANLLWLCTLSSRPSPGPLLRVLYFSRVPSLFSESSKVSLLKGS